MATFGELFTAFENLKDTFQAMQGKKLSSISVPETNRTFASIEFKGWDGEKEVTFTLGNSSESFSLFYLYFCNTF